MKTTFDLPQELFREAKAMAARQGQPLKKLVADALRAWLAGFERRGSDRPWMRHFGALADLPAEEHERINRRIEEFCERVDDEKWK